MREKEGKMNFSTKKQQARPHNGKEIASPKEWLSAREASEYTGLGFSTMAKLRLQGGSAPFSKIGEKVLYNRADLDAWIMSKRVANTSQSAT